MPRIPISTMWDRENRNAIENNFIYLFENLLGVGNVQEENIADGAVTSRKRTKLGELAVVTLTQNTRDNFPNFNTNTKVLSFPDTFFILSGKDRYTVSGGRDIDLSNILNQATGALVYYNTETNDFQLLNQVNAHNASEHSILVAAVYFQSNGPLLGFYMNTRFTIDGIDSTAYFIRENMIRADRVAPQGAYAIITVGQSSALPNYDNNTKKLTFESFNIFYRNRRFFISSGHVFDFSSFSAAGVAAYYVPSTNSFLLRTQTNITGLPIDAILIFVATFRSGMFLQRLHINCEYTVDGKPLYAPYSENGNSDDKPYVFAVDRLSGSYSDSDLSGVGDQGSPFNYFDDDHELVYGLYDDLMNAYPDYIVRTELGRTDNDIPIYEYSFSPPRPGNVSAIRPFPKIIIGASIHGGENMAVNALYYFMERICNDSQNDKALNYLRNNINFLICPLRSPRDYDQKAYVNENGVNVNRNFSYGWDTLNDPTKGPEPFSEVEARVQRDWLLVNTESIHHIDLHVRGGRQSVDDDKIMWLSQSTIQQAEFGANTIEQMTRRWRQKYPQLPNMFYGYGTVSQAGGTIRTYSQHIAGIPTTTWEGFSRSTTMSEVENADVVNMNVDYLGQYVINVIKHYQHR